MHSASFNAGQRRVRECNGDNCATSATEETSKEIVALDGHGPDMTLYRSTVGKRTNGSRAAGHPTVEKISREDVPVGS